MRLDQAADVKMAEAEKLAQSLLQTVDRWQEGTYVLDRSLRVKGDTFIFVIEKVPGDPPGGRLTLEVGDRIVSGPLPLWNRGTCSSLREAFRDFETTKSQRDAQEAHEAVLGALMGTM